jgi:hypothetical protein
MNNYHGKLYSKKTRLFLTYTSIEAFSTIENVLFGCIVFLLKLLMEYCRTITMRKRVEMMARSTTAKNGHERIVSDRDNAKHLEYFMNGQWKHSENCKTFTNRDCTFKAEKSSLH